MKTIFIPLFALWMCSIRPAAAQESVTVSFSNPVLQESKFIQASTNLQGIYALETLVTGKIAGKRYRLDLVHVADGRENRRTNRYAHPIRWNFFSHPDPSAPIRSALRCGPR